MCRLKAKLKPGYKLLANQIAVTTSDQDIHNCPIKINDKCIGLK